MFWPVGSYLIDTPGEGKSVNTPVSLALIYWQCVGADLMEGVYA